LFTNRKERFTMDQSTFQAIFSAMLERRGYQEIRIEPCKDGLECSASATAGAIEVERVLPLDGDEITSMDREQARDLIDNIYGEWMQHVVHPCGHVLLYASAVWEGDGPYASLPHPAYYQVPVYDEARPIKRCPHCKERLDARTALPRVEDPNTQ
jgi:hypothetical protein